MTAVPYPVRFRLTPQNRSSIAALLAILEAELPAGLIETRLISAVDQLAGPGLLVYSFMSSQAPSVARELALVRERQSEALLALAGGPHPSSDPQGTLDLGFRWSAVGEAGRSFARLVQAVAQGNPPPPGISAEETRLPLDHYPAWPASGQLFCGVELSRGCPMGCAFCQTPALHGRRARHRSLPALRRLFEHAVGTGHTFTRFIAPNAFGYGAPGPRAPDPRAVEGLLAAARQSGMTRVFLGSFPSEVRPESVTPELLALVRDYCDNQALVVGLQSGSPALLQRIQRGHTVEEGVQAVALIAAAGFLPRVDFIFGLPGESDADRRLTRELIRHLTATYGARINTHLFAPLPGTPLQDATPTPIDSKTRELLEEITGRGQANALRCFRTGQDPPRNYLI